MSARPSPWIDDDFDTQLDSRWAQVRVNGGRVSVAHSALRFEMPEAHIGRYTDAQIDDYSGGARPRFLWRPPLRMEVVARAEVPEPATSGDDTRQLRGTAGFGFWNYPLSLKGTILRLPDAVWFFYASPPSNMALVPGVAGHGWKAQVVHAHRWQALAAGLPALGTVALARLTPLRRPAERWVRRVTGASEALLDPSTLWSTHTYTLDWREHEARFAVDGAYVLSVPDPPQGPLGFVAWLDNQYAVATPRGELAFGTVASGPQALVLESLRVQPL